jgi:hypothetical protein
MGTRGAYGFYKDGVNKITYNHYDSYPSCLGHSMIEFVQDNSDENLNAIFDKIEMVEESSTPTEEQKKECEKWTSLAVSSQSTDDWYCLLRNAQGVPEEFNKGLKFMTNGEGFLRDSLFCEHAYVLNLDTKELEYYVGFQHVQNENRYSVESAENGYYSVALATSISFNHIRCMLVGEIIEEMDNAREKLEEKQAGKPEFTGDVEVAVYIVNLGKINEGVSPSDCGKWLVLPVSQDELDEALEEIGIDGEQYEEFVINDVDNEFSDIWTIGETDDFDTVNETVETLEYMKDEQRDCVKAVVAAGFESFEDAVWKVKQGRYSLSTSINDAEEYARELCDSCYNIPEYLQNYIDYKSMGEDWIADNSDVELTDYGLVRRE